MLGSNVIVLPLIVVFVVVLLPEGLYADVIVDPFIFVISVSLLFMFTTDPVIVVSVPLFADLTYDPVIVVLLLSVVLA